MKIKDIWKDFKKTTVAAFKDGWSRIRAVWKATWEIFKIALIDFVKAVFTWVWSIISGVASILIDVLKIVFAALSAAVKATLGIAYEKIVAWIKKA